jgi:uncharacterized damage-inducible protein DinB
VEARLAPLYEIFKFNSRFFLNSLDGMDDDQAGWRARDDSNSAAYIALHLLDSRHNLARRIGIEREHRLGDVAKEAKGKPNFTGLPALEEIRDEWKSVTGDVRARFAQLTTADLNQAFETQIPLEDRTILGYLGFAMMHEAYHVGQLSMVRKQVGLPAMAMR